MSEPDTKTLEKPKPEPMPKHNSFWKRLLTACLIGVIAYAGEEALKQVMSPVDFKVLRESGCHRLDDLAQFSPYQLAVLTAQSFTSSASAQLPLQTKGYVWNGDSCAAAEHENKAYSEAYDFCQQQSRIALTTGQSPLPADPVMQLDWLGKLPIISWFISKRADDGDSKSLGSTNDDFILQGLQDWKRGPHLSSGHVPGLGQFTDSPSVTLQPSVERPAGILANGRLAGFVLRRCMAHASDGLGHWGRWYIDTVAQRFFPSYLLAPPFGIADMIVHTLFKSTWGAAFNWFFLLLGLGLAWQLVERLDGDAAASFMVVVVWLPLGAVLLGSLGAYAAQWVLYFGLVAYDGALRLLSYCLGSALLLWGFAIVSRGVMGVVEHDAEDFAKHWAPKVFSRFFSRFFGSGG